MKTATRNRSRDPERTRAHILEVASREIYEHGFQGVSIDRIIKETNVTKGAFFHYFSTKSDLGYAIVDELLREMVLDRWIRPLAAYKNPVQGILKRFKALTGAMSDENLVRGCPLNNLTQEMSSVDPLFRKKLKAVMTLWIDETGRYLKKAQESGYLKKTVNTRRLAEFIVATEEGSFGLVKSMADRKIYTSLYNSLRDYLVSKAEDS
jgi:TetR/AcrR family transcriptional regulator, transcriptional repressor for nem operon